MDYLKIPRSVIYKERNDLNDFGVRTPETMNYLLFMRMKQLVLMGVPGAREVALRCYNNAYYICTIILLEADDFPELRISDYVNTILEIEKDKQYTNEVCLASMAMACLLLAKYDEKRYAKDSEIWNAIYHRCTHYQWYNSTETDIFLHMISLEYSCTNPLSNSEFEPRDITDVIDNFSERHLQVYAEYICERLAHLKDTRQRIYWTDMAVAQIKAYKLELCEDSGYNPKKDCFKYVDNDPSMIDFTWEDKVRGYYQQSNEAIKYYTEHYPTKEENDSQEKTEEFAQAPETEVLQTKIMELESKLTQQEKQLIEVSKMNDQYANRIKELDTENKSLQGQLKEANTIPDNVTAQQRVRMELARKLMDAAGINKDVLAKWGNKDKAGTVMGTMLDIVPSTCKTYLSDPSINHEHHKETVDKINPLLEALGLKFKL